MSIPRSAIWATGRKKVKVGASRAPGPPRAAVGRCHVACGLRGFQAGCAGMTLDFSRSWTCIWRYYT
jgi:hypothetical protein